MVCFQKNFLYHQTRMWNTWDSKSVPKSPPSLSSKSLLNVNILIYSGPATWTGQCVKDSSDRVLPDVFLTLKDDNTPTECIRRCREEDEGYAYAGVQYAVQCFCANEPPPSDTIVDESQCSKKCSGDKDLNCGGDWRMNVYETGRGSTFCRALHTLHTFIHFTQLSNFENLAQFCTVYTI